MNSLLKQSLFLSLAIGPTFAFAEACVGPKAEDTACLKAEDVRLTIELNELHWKMIAHSDSLRQGFLELSRRAWGEYVKSHCVVEWDLSRLMFDEYSRAGALTANNDNLRCLIRLKQQRLVELKTIQAKSISKKK